MTRERLLRALGIGATAALGARLALLAPDRPEPARVTTTGLVASLARATRTKTPSVHLEASRALSPDERDWLRALDRAGTQVTWVASPALPALAVQVEPVIAPGARQAVAVVTSPGVPVAVRDTIGLVDSLRTGKHGVLSLVSSIDGRLGVSSAGAMAFVETLDTAVVRSVIVVGPAGWESKYIVAALEESGWQVEDAVEDQPVAFVAGLVAEAIIVGRGLIEAEQIVAVLL